MNNEFGILIFEWKRNIRDFIFPILRQSKFNFPEILFLFLFIFSFSISAKDIGVCYKWSEGDAQHLDSCEASSLEECSNGKKEISKKDTGFQNYSGKLFLDKENQGIYEFKKGTALDCDKEIIKSARSAELTMCGNWGNAVYSTGLKFQPMEKLDGSTVNLSTQTQIVKLSS